MKGLLPSFEFAFSRPHRGMVQVGQLVKQGNHHRVMIWTIQVAKSDLRILHSPTGFLSKALSPLIVPFFDGNGVGSKVLPDRVPQLPHQLMINSSEVASPQTSLHTFSVRRTEGWGKYEIVLFKKPL